MNMAKAAAQLITSSLRHPNGMPVECVIADTTIGGVAEAAACAEKFAEGVGVSLSVTPAGAMDLKLWIWILLHLKLMGI